MNQFKLYDPLKDIFQIQDKNVFAKLVAFLVNKEQIFNKFLVNKANWIKVHKFVRCAESIHKSNGSDN